MSEEQVKQTQTNTQSTPTPQTSMPTPVSQPNEHENIPFYLWLIVIGGILAIALGIIIGIVHLLASVVFLSATGFFGAIINTIVSVICGFLLLVSYNICKRNKFMGSIFAGIFSLVLLIFWPEGLIGGIFGILGAILTFLKSLDEAAASAGRDVAAARSAAPQQTTAPTPQTQPSQSAAITPEPTQAKAPTTPEANDVKTTESVPSTDSIFCRQCGTKIPGNSVFCQSCGFKLS